MFFCQRLKYIHAIEYYLCKYNRDILLGCRLIIEECITDIYYIQGDKNIVTDTLSRFTQNDKE